MSEAARTRARPAADLPTSFGRARPVTTGVRPTVYDGHYPAKGALGERATVEADIFADGHDELSAHVRFRHEAGGRWETAPLEPVGNDHWRGGFSVLRNTYGRGREDWSTEGHGAHVPHRAVGVECEVPHLASLQLRRGRSSDVFLR